MSAGLSANSPAGEREPSRLDLWSGRLRLAALRVPGSGVVAARAWLRGGARLEPLPGLSLLCGRMLVDGSARRTWREIAEQAEARGVSLGGLASAEVHGLAVDALADDAGLALEWLTELLLEPGFDPARFELLRTQTLGELRSLGDRPEVVTGWAFRDQLYHPHPLAWPSQGTNESLARLTPDDCRRFHVPPRRAAAWSPWRATSTRRRCWGTWSDCSMAFTGRRPPKGESAPVNWRRRPVAPSIASRSPPAHSSRRMCMPAT